VQAVAVPVTGTGSWTGRCQARAWHLQLIRRRIVGRAAVPPADVVPARVPNSVVSSSTTRADRRHNEDVDIRSRVQAHIRRHELIPPDGEVTCLVSGGPDSTCLWHVLRSLGYRVSALHVNHRLRGREADEDAEHCRELMGAEVVVAPPAETEAALRRIRYSFAADRLRATGHTASDQVETVLYRLVSSGRPGGIKVRREDGVVRPLLPLWREETEAYCRDEGLPIRRDSTNDGTKRGLIRTEILPALERLDPRARANLLTLAADEGSRLPRTVERTLLGLLSRVDGTKEADLGSGVRAVREYECLSLEHGPVRYGPWTISATVPGLEVRSRRPGDRLAGRRRKLQDVFVDAKVPRRERASWPIVVRGDEVVAVPGIVEDPRVRAERDSSGSGAAGGGRGA
jgi:tRNA(Ile)-lysidine synthase